MQHFNNGQVGFEWCKSWSPKASFHWVSPGQLVGAHWDDAGPGSTVLEEQLSHGCDLSNMSGHAIPAVLHGDQCAALFDTEPAEDEIPHGVSHNIQFTQIVQDFCVSDSNLTIGLDRQRD